MSFSSEHVVKATREGHRCDGCRQPILKGASAVCWPGMTDGDSGHAIWHPALWHPECREAEVTYNREILDGCWDEWSSLEDCVAEGGEEWLRAEHPAVAERLCGPVEAEPARA